MSRLTTIPLDKHRDDPETSAPIQDWWRGVHDHVFIALHPFTAEDKAIAGVDFTEQNKAGSPVRWRAMADRVGSPDFADFAIAVVMATYGIRSETRTKLGLPVPPPDLAAALRKDVETRGLCEPWDDRIAPVVELALAEAFRRIGSETLVVYSEFRDHRAFIARDLLAGPSAAWRHALSQPVHALQDPAGGMLVTASFDDLWSLVALTDAARASVNPETLLEGFWAGPLTTIDWLNERGSFDPPEGWA